MSKEYGFSKVHWMVVLHLVSAFAGAGVAGAIYFQNPSRISVGPSPRQLAVTQASSYDEKLNVRDKSEAPKQLRQTQNGTVLISSYEKLSPQKRSELLCEWLKSADEACIDFILSHMPLNDFDKTTLTQSGGGTNPAFAARLLYKIGLSSGLPEMLNLDLATIPLEKHYSCSELQQFQKSGVAGLEYRIIISAGMKSPADIDTIMSAMLVTKDSSEHNKFMSKLVGTWVQSNPNSLVGALTASKALINSLGLSLGKDRSLNAPENLPLRDSIRKLCFASLDEDLGGAPQGALSKSGVVAFVTLTNPVPDRNFRDTARQIRSDSAYSLLMTAAIQEWTSNDIVATTQWLSHQANEPEYRDWVAAFADSCKDPYIAGIWKASTNKGTPNSEDP